MLKDETYYSKDECAKLIGVSPGTVYNWIKSGDGKIDYNTVSCNHGKSGIKYMIPGSWIREYLKEKQIKDADKYKKRVVREIEPRVVDSTIPAILRVMNAVADRVEGNITCDERCRYVNALAHLVDAMNKTKV